MLHDRWRKIPVKIPLGPGYSAKAVVPPPPPPLPHTTHRLQNNNFHPNRLRMRKTDLVNFVDLKFLIYCTLVYTVQYIYVAEYNGLQKRAEGKVFKI